MVVFPNIKVNLGLYVLRKRQDGYHDIATAMVGVDWCDVLEVGPIHRKDELLTDNSTYPVADSLLSSGIPISCPPEKNLVIRAVKAVRSVRPDLPSVEVCLHKNVPDGAGLGGGSSDAAFTIRALNERFGLGMSDTLMADIASGIGSDCPFFIYNNPMLATGRGEILEPLPELSSKLSGYNIVVVKPFGVAVSTTQAYAGITPKDSRMPLTDILARSVTEWRHLLVNDFEESISRFTDIPAKIKSVLYSLGAVYAAMSGSGSAVFGIFSAEDVQRTDFQDVFKDCNVHVGRFIL